MPPGPVQTFSWFSESWKLKFCHLKNFVMEELILRGPYFAIFADVIVFWWQSLRYLEKYLCWSGLVYEGSPYMVRLMTSQIRHLMSSGLIGCIFQSAVFVMVSALIHGHNCFSSLDCDNVEQLILYQDVINMYHTAWRLEKYNPCALQC